MQLPCEYGTFQAHCFVNDITGEEHVALVKGDLGDGRDVLCRVHSECLTGDVFGSKRCDCGEQLHAALAAIEAEGRGVLLYMRQEGRGIGLMNKLRAYELQEQGMEFIEVDTDAFAKAMIDGVLPILTDSQKKIYDAIAALA